MSRIWNLAAVLLITLPASTQGQDIVDGFQARTYLGPKGANMPYRLFVPDEQARLRPLPLIVYLHGGGGVGADNLLQITGGNTAGTHSWTTAEMQGRHAAFVLAPQLPVNNRWSAPDSDLPSPYAALVLDLIGDLSKEFQIDADRIYLVGQSLGGQGTWDLVSKRPDLWAAAVPLCSDGNTERIRAARKVAIWAFHGAKDQAVPVSGSRDLVAALRVVGSAIKYTEYPDVGHDVWTVAFAEPDLADWLFAQRREPK
jgi:predicted peptidase